MSVVRKGSYEFLVSKSEITQGQWMAVMGTNPSHFKFSELHPVESISLWDSLYFVNQLSDMHRLDSCYDLSECRGKPGTGCDVSSLSSYLSCRGDYICSEKTATPKTNCNGYRLLSEKEWSLMAELAKNYKSFSDRKCSDIQPLQIREFCSHSPKRCGPKAVGSGQDFFVSDVVGNVFEWTHTLIEMEQEWTRAIARGGAWISPSSLCDSQSVQWEPAKTRAAYIGLRIARSKLP